MAYNIRDHEGIRLAHEKTLVNDVLIHYCIGGPKTGPAVMLVHGVPKTMFTWRKVIPFLTPKFRVLAVDARGFGDSERPSTGYDCETIASDLVKVADAAGFDKFRIVGEDWGAAWAWTVAAQHPDRVVGLVFQEMLLPGLGFEAGHRATGGTEAKKLKAWDNRTLWHLVFFRVPDFPEMLVSGRERQFWTQWMRSEMLDPSALTPEDIDEYTGWVSGPGGMRAVCEVYRDTDKGAVTNAELMKTKLQMPVLGVGGDFFFGEVPRVQMEQVADNVSGVVIHSGHNIALENPEDLGKAYVDFFNRTET